MKDNPHYLDPEDPSSDFPPSYTEATASSSDTLTTAPSYTTHLSAHLASLPSAIRTNQDSHLAHQAALDADLLSLVTPQIDNLISDLSARSPDPRAPPTTATLILVPAAAVPPSARHVHDTPGGDDITRVSRISDPKGLLRGPDAKARSPSIPRARDSSPSTREFSDWGRWDDDDGTVSTGDEPGQQWWWRDEDMAWRLARHLRPQAPVDVSRAHVRESAEQQRWERTVAGALGRFRSRDGDRGPGEGKPAPEPRMAVSAEEVTFRRENEMGIWESMSGWAVVVRLNISRG